jgi:site-specific DNA recombinase
VTPERRTTGHSRQRLVRRSPGFKLNEQVNNHKITRIKSEALLVGRIFDDRGNRMTPSHARKGSIKYRYYLSSALIQGMAERAGSIRRVPAAEIETLVARSVREHLKPSEPIDDRSLVNARLARVEVQPQQLVIQLVPAKSNRRRSEEDETLHVPWHKTPSTRRREILLPSDTSLEHARPIRSETRATLVTSIARGRRWLDELTADATATADRISESSAAFVKST